MDNKEYIIISKTAIQKRIEELEVEQEKNHLVNVEKFNCLISEIKAYRNILSQSTPLIPVLEDCFEHGVGSGKYKQEYGENANGSLSKQDYISNLKLDK
jgi:hypothetical protein